MLRAANGFRIMAFTHCITMFYEIWGKHDYDIPGVCFSPGMTVIDIGANQGFFSLYAASKGAMVYAFEPCAENFAILTDNVSRNGMQARVKAFKAAVTDLDGEVDLFVGLDVSGGILSGTVSTCNDNRGGEGVEKRVTQSVTLDSIFAELHLDKCDFLKMDCEGAEYGILKSTSQDLFDRIAIISMEFHDSHGREAAGILRKAGFEVVHEQSGKTGILKAVSPRWIPRRLSMQSSDQRTVTG